MLELYSLFRRIQFEWFTKSPYIAYSHVEEGLFCAPCVVFTHEKMVGKGSHVKPGLFAAKAFRKLKDFHVSFKKITTLKTPKM